MSGPTSGGARAHADPTAMSTILASLAIAGCIFTGGMIGLHLHRVLPRHHLTKDTLDVIKLGTGMLSVLASLVLGLLIAQPSRRMIRQSRRSRATPRNSRC